MEVRALNMNENVVNIFDVTYDNSDCTSEAKFIKTIPLDKSANGWYCVNRDQYNAGYLKWQTKQCKKR